MHILQKVICPTDRGDAPYRGTVFDISGTEYRNHKGDPFRWVTVRRDDTLTKHIWPSNRLEII